MEDYVGFAVKPSQRYHLTWKEQQPNGKSTTNTIVSQHVASKGRALAWLLNLKPYIKVDTVTIKAWNRNCKQ